MLYGLSSPIMEVQPIIKKEQRPPKYNEDDVAVVVNAEGFICIYDKKTSKLIDKYHQSRKPQPVTQWYSPDRAMSILAQIQEGATISQALTASKVPTAVFNSWRRHNPQFEAQVKQARQLRKEVREEEFEEKRIQSLLSVNPETLTPEELENRDAMLRTVQKEKAILGIDRQTSKQSESLPATPTVSFNLSLGKEEAKVISAKYTPKPT